ncbi:hypothetical protein ScalyP_jg4926 [Parmales sp. scaly parma]|nr:hypothetical protein ScalyP_jg4926 [Parmales sp. scaly parma]
MLLDSIPSQYQIAAIVATSIIGFLFVITLSAKLTSTPGYLDPNSEEVSGTPSKAKGGVKRAAPKKAATPKRSTPARNSMGTVDTPNGRRSARIGSRKE